MGKKHKCECGGYIKPGGMQRHLKTIVHQDRMKYPNGCKFDNIYRNKCIVVYGDEISEET